MIVHSTVELATFTRDRRQRLRLSQGTVGDRVGLRQETISNFENKPETTQLATLFKILSALDFELHLVPKEESNQGKKGWSEEW